MIETKSRRCSSSRLASCSREPTTIRKARFLDRVLCRKTRKSPAGQTLTNLANAPEAGATIESQRIEYRKRFLQDVRRRLKEVASKDYVNPAEHTVDCVLLFIPNGLEPPNWFYWQNTRHELSPRLWAILKCLWNNDRVKAEELVERVWGDEGEIVADGTIRGRLSELNTRLANIGVPWQFHLRKGFVVKG